METTPDDREHGYDDQVEQEAYERAEESGDQDAGPASTPEEPRPPADE
jgi:hypothetical protein